MELKIYSPTADGFVKEITWNHEEIKKEVAEKVQYYKNLVYTDDQIPDAKKERATLNKFVRALEDKRKEIKKQCLAPYEEFERQMKEIIEVVNEPIRMIDSQVKAYEQQKRDDKANKIKEIFAEIGFQPFVKLEAIFRNEWLNASVSLKKIREEMTSIMYQIGNDITAINALPEFSFESMEVYRKTLDVSKAIQEGQRLADIQKRKAEYEAKRKAEEEAKKEAEAKTATEKATAEKPEEIATHITPPDPDALRESLAPADRQWVAFKALLSVEDAQALANFFAARKIEYAPIETRLD